MKSLVQFDEDSYEPRCNENHHWIDANWRLESPTVRTNPMQNRLKVKRVFEFVCLDIEVEKWSTSNDQDSMLINWISTLSTQYNQPITKSDRVSDLNMKSISDSLLLLQSVTKTNLDQKRIYQYMNCDWPNEYFQPY